MKCPNCNKEIEPHSRFCIFCGSYIDELQEEQPTETSEGTEDEFNKQLQTLRQEISRLKKFVVHQDQRLLEYQKRLTSLERTKGVVTPTPTATPVPPKAVTPSREMAPVNAAGVAQLFPERPEPPRQVPAAKAKERGPEWEWILGGNWLARIGVLALVIGIAFLLKLAYDNDWINPAGWVSLGTIAGLILLGGGYFWQRRYPTLAQALSGGGIAILYLSVFAAFSTFELIGIYLATGLLLLVSVTSAVMAIKYNSMALAIIGIFGAFSAPFLLTGFESGIAEATQVDRSSWLLVYIVVVDIGVLALSAFRNWRWFTLIALVGSLVAFGAWYSRFGDEADLLISQGSLTLIFLIFAGATMLYHIVWRRPSQDFDYALIVINAASYFGISYGILRTDLAEWMGGFSFLLAAFYGVLSYAVLKRGAVNTRLSYFALGIALVLLTIAIPIQIGDKAWVTAAWAAEGAVLIWLSAILRLPLLRNFSYLAFAAMAVRLLFVDARLNLPDVQPFINERFLVFLISIIATCFAGWWERRALSQPEVNESYYLAFFLAASLFFAVSMPVELGNSIWVTVAWTAGGAILAWISFTVREPALRGFGYALFIAMAVRLLFFDTKVDISTFQPVINERFLVFLIGITATYLTGYFLWWKRKSLQEWEKTNWSIFPIFFVTASFFTIWLLSAEVISFFDSRIAALTPGDTESASGLQSAKNLSLTALWALYAVIVLVIGIVKRIRLVRLAALALLAVPVIKVFAYDVFALEQVYRIIAFVGLGLLLVTSGYLYNRYSSAIKEFFIKK